MNEETRADIIAMLVKLDFVMWDRFVNPADGEYFIYGWIYRDINEAHTMHERTHDFVVLSWYQGQWWYITSSKKYTDTIAKIIDGTEEDHCVCQRVETEFDIKNVIRL